jgi:hypothetical protein
MDLHQNAQSCPASRGVLVERVEHAAALRWRRHLRSMSRPALRGEWPAAAGRSSSAASMRSNPSSAPAAAGGCGSSRASPTPGWSARFSSTSPTRESMRAARLPRPPPSTRPGRRHRLDALLHEPCDFLPGRLPCRASHGSMPRFPVRKSPNPTAEPLIDHTDTLTIPSPRLSSIQVRKEVPNHARAGRIGP